MLYSHVDPNLDPQHSHQKFEVAKHSCDLSVGVGGAKMGRFLGVAGQPNLNNEHRVQGESLSLKRRWRWRTMEVDT